MPKSEILPRVRVIFDDVNIPQLVAKLSEALTARYPACYDFTLQWEGGYVNHPDDPGGCTNKGITLRTWRDWRDNPTLTCEDLKTISDLEVALIYGSNYWAPVWGNDLPLGLNLCVWDWGVNSGPSRAVKYLQQMIGSAADGIMGPNTMAAVNKYVDLVGLDQTITEYTGLRQNYYEQLSTWPTFGDGWTNRNKACDAEAKRLAALGPWTPDLPTPKPPEPSDLEARVTKLENWAGGFGR